MGLHQVIEDSDNDDGYSSADKSPAKVNEIIQQSTIEAGTVPILDVSLQTVTNSTDPILFQAVYDAHLGDAQVQSDDLRNEQQSHIFEDAIINQHMSSSDVSVRKLKRSKTMNVSSVTSISEPTASNRKAKRTKSMKDVDDLTQVTTPRTSEDVRQKDFWEFPGSSASDKLTHTTQKMAGGNTGRNNSLKTYGRQLRRSQTIAEASSSPSSDWPALQISEEDVSRATNLKRSSRSHGEDLSSMLQKPKRHKRGMSVNGDLLKTRRTEHLCTVQQDVPSPPRDPIRASAELPNIQAPWSTSEEPRLGTIQPSSGKIHHDASVNPSTTDTEPLTTSFVPQAFEQSRSSIVIIPNTLTEMQKLQYDVISVASTAQSRRSSLPATMERADPNFKYTGDSSTVPNDTPLPRVSPGAAQTPASPRRLSSSPAIQSANRRIKRAKSEVGLKALPSSTVSSSSNKVTKRRARSKTIAPGEKPPRREVSVDELSLVPLDSVENARTNCPTAKRNGIRRTYNEDEEERMSIDELFSSDEIVLQKEPYQPRASLSRSKSMSVHSLNNSVKRDLSKANATHTKSLKVAKLPIACIPGHIISTPEAPAQLGIIHGDARMTASLAEAAHNENAIYQEGISESHESAENTLENPAETEVLLAAPIVPAQSKRRGRKKMSDITCAQHRHVQEIQRTDSSTTRRVGESEPSALRETESNKQQSQGPSSTPTLGVAVEIILGESPSKASTDIPSPVQTPTGDSKKGPDQHSPLHSGKVPYRVGLSKRTRIAPLLKIIRK